LIRVIDFALAVCAFVIALTNGLGRRPLAPLWVAVVLISLALILPDILSVAV
jgi:hypothetical protein